MDIGFDTIGNATIICYDRGPVLVTDPWISDSAYFGSWTLSHEIPAEQMAAIRSCKFVWFSHGHPDHLNPQSLPKFRSRTILLPDHAGGRIRKELAGRGYDVRVLADRTWVPLSDRIRVLCIADYNQDAILLIDVAGTLLIDTNDASDRGWGRFVRRTARGYATSFLLAISGWGDADMNNFHDEGGNLASPLVDRVRFPLGKRIAKQTESFGAKYFVPFSSMHRYQRADSVWANPYVQKLPDYSRGFESKTAQILPPFLRYDASTGNHSTIDPPVRPAVVRAPEEFGDRWDEGLERGDVEKIRRYFTSIEHLGAFLDFVNVRVGGEDHVIELAKGGFHRGVTFEVPRHSLMVAIGYEIFDDLLIGNFMKTTLHGKWPRSGLYPHFTPFVSKYADNGRAKTSEELRAYFEEYRRRAGFDYIRHRFEQRSIDVFRAFVPSDSGAYEKAKHLYWQARKSF